MVSGYVGTGSGEESWIHKVDPEGQLLWTTFLDAGSRANAVAVNSHDEIVAAGQADERAWVATYRP